MAEKTIATNQDNQPTSQADRQAPATREESRYLVPPVDIFETQDGLTVLVDLPGVDKDAVEISVDDRILTISGKVEQDIPGQVDYREFSLLDFRRQFELGEQVDQEKITAGLDHGVLTINLPKAEKAKPRQISVNSD